MLFPQSSPPLLDVGQAEHRWDLFPGWHCPFQSLFRDSVQVGSKPYLARVILELLWPLEKKMIGWEEKSLNFQKHESLLGKGSEETAHLHTRKWPQGSPFAEPHLNLELFTVDLCEDDKFKLSCLKCLEQKPRDLQIDLRKRN